MEENLISSCVQETVNDLKLYGIIILIVIAVSIIFAIVSAIVKSAQRRAEEKRNQRNATLSNVGLSVSTQVIEPQNTEERILLIQSSKDNLERLYNEYLSNQIGTVGNGKQIFAEFKKNYLAQVKDKGILDAVLPLFDKYEPLFAKVVTLADIDKMSGKEFESFTASLLSGLKYRNIELTKASNDQGVDVVAEKDGVRYAIQCKRYASNLGNKPVQEVHTGKYLYHCDVGVVLTNQYFTVGAKQAAEMTGTLLWDRDYLLQMLNEVQL